MVELMSAPVPATVGTLLCWDFPDLLPSVCSQSPGRLFQWAGVVVCNFRVIILIGISWRTKALVHSGHETVEHELQNTILILLIRIVMAFSCKGSWEEQKVWLIKNSLMRIESSTKLIHSHCTLNTVIFARAFKLFLMCQTSAVIQSWQYSHSTAAASVLLGFFSWKKVKLLYEKFTENKLDKQYVTFIICTLWFYFTYFETCGLMICWL